ncbi:MAG: endonuclease/exonuclease/phosphatase family protein [Bacteroidia bacterium]|nr:endonuclease/exonuclease/phosphatase family protein [Bacteroidia bacterium]
MILKITNSQLKIVAVLFIFWMISGCKQANGSDRNLPDKTVESGKEVTAKIKEVVVGFYNVENLFDTQDNPEKEDSEFLPEGRFKWDEAKYLKKLDNLALAIGGMGKNGPDILGVAEVENMQVMKDLVEKTALKTRGYEIIHEESEDVRGIDVGLIYDPKIFQYVGHKAYNVDFPEESDYTSRPLLVVEGKIKGETLYVIVNHWPSRIGGEQESESRRLTVAKVAREKIVEILAKDPNACIVSAGDFNDDPHNKSIVDIMNARISAEGVVSGGFYNPVGALHDPNGTGTLTYQGKWNLFDQVLVSYGLMNDGKGKLRYMEGSAAIHNPEFMQVGGDGPAKDMPKRAIYRNEFQDSGFSDHFPVYVRLIRK